MRSSGLAKKLRKCDPTFHPANDHIVFLPLRTPKRHIAYGQGWWSNGMKQGVQHNNNATVRPPAAMHAKDPDVCRNPVHSLGYKDQKAQAGKKKNTTRENAPASNLNSLQRHQIIGPQIMAPQAEEVGACLVLPTNSSGER